MSRGKRREKSRQELNEEITTFDIAIDDTILERTISEQRRIVAIKDVLFEKTKLQSISVALKEQKKGIKEQEKVVRIFKKNLRGLNGKLSELDDKIISLQRRKKLRENRIKKLKEFNPTRREV